MSGIFFPNGMERLGGLVLGGAAVTTGVLTIPARDMLLVLMRVTGYSGTDIASLRFNADSTVGNYTSSFVTATSATAPPVLARVNNAGTLGHIPAGSTGITTGRVAQYVISNFATTRKVATIQQGAEQTTTAAGTIDIFGFGEWLNTAAQITSIEMRTSGGTNTLSAGSGFEVYGINLGS